MSEQKSCETCGNMICIGPGNHLPYIGYCKSNDFLNWEPKKSCGNCEKREYSAQDGKNYYCTIRGHFNDIANGIWDDGCSNWVPREREALQGSTHCPYSGHELGTKRET